MRRIVASISMSLDGVVERPERWSLSYYNDQAGKYANELLFGSSALLLGRRTYESFAQSWPARSGDVADQINSMPKYVVSTTLGTAGWTNSTIIRGNVAAEVARLKRQPGQPLLVYGSGTLVHTLLGHDLLDDLRVWIHPLLVGHGRPGDLLFRDQTGANLKLTSVEAFRTGVVVLAYAPAAKA